MKKETPETEASDFSHGLLARRPFFLCARACVGAHHLGRKLRAFGHDIRLMPVHRALGGARLTHKAPDCPATQGPRLPRKAPDCPQGPRLPARPQTARKAPDCPQGPRLPARPQTARKAPDCPQGPRLPARPQIAPARPQGCPAWALWNALRGQSSALRQTVEVGLCVLGERSVVRTAPP